MVVGIFCADLRSASGQVPPCGPPRPAWAGWTASFTAGCRDSSGRFAGGSQIIHLVGHKGQLYAAAGYWKDSHNVIYGGHDSRTGWAQILRLANPDAPWTVDLEMGPRHLRPELLSSVTFTRDATGRALPAPDTLLIAAAWDDGGRGRRSVQVFVHDDSTNAWTRTDAVPNTADQVGEDISVRAAIVYRDRLTGREYLFLSVGIVGLFRAEYDPGQPGRLLWSRAPEFVPAGPTRILGLAEANGSLFVSDGAHIFRRIDGPAPRYEKVVDLSGDVDPQTDRKAFSGIGGIRGMTAIAVPAGHQESLIFMWHPGKTSRGCIIRLDREPDGRYTQHQEECLSRLASKHTGLPASFILGAYSRFMPFTDPANGETLHIAGMEAWVPARASQSFVAHNQRGPQGGPYAGAMYAVRDPRGHWRMGEVNGKFQPGMPELVSTYTYALSPFGGQDAGRIYLGGYDCNDHPSTDTAWVYRTHVENLLRRPAR